MYTGDSFHTSGGSAGDDEHFYWRVEEFEGQLVRVEANVEQSTDLKVIRGLVDVRQLRGRLRSVIISV